MYTVMIIDDEPLIRRGLESLIAWEEAGCHLVGQASNGEEGIAKIREYRPDIVFTDMKMPKMDGITMMAEAAKDEDAPVFIVLSGYNDFELVRAALRLGAIDYLMKLDLDEQGLSRVLAEAVERIAENRKEQGGGHPVSGFKEDFLRGLIKMSPDKEFYDKMKQQSVALKEGYFYRILVLKLTEQPDEAWQQSSLTQNFFLNICKEAIPEGIEVYEFHMGADRFALYMEQAGGFLQEALMAQCAAMKTAIKKYLNQEIAIGISAPHHNAMHVAEAYEEAGQSLAFRISGVNAKIHFYTDLLNRSYLESQLERMKTEPDYLEAMEHFLLQLQKFITQRATWEEAVQICYRLMGQLYELDGNSRPFFVKWFDMEYVTKGDFDRIGSLEGLSRWLLHLESGIVSYSQEYMGEIYRYKVKKAKQYIYENRYRKIALNDVAEELGITPGYLSRIFKKVTLQSFSDYIAEIKIEEAKKLLLQDNNRVYEVSSLLGYDDPYYFSKVFKRVTQMTPSEYIARN